MPCKNFDGWLIGQKPGQTLIVKTRCKMWTCDYCAKINREMWQAKIIHGINQIGGDEWSFITLTAHENANNLQSSMRNIQNGWKKLQTRIRRKITSEGKEKTLHYARVYEQHKDGRVHWHMVASWVPSDYIHPDNGKGKGSRWISDNARQCGMGYQTMALSIDGHGGYIASYVTKYMVKSSHEWPKNTRIITTSRNWPTKTIAEKNDYHWKTQSTVTETDIRQWFKFGDEIIDLNTNLPVTYDTIDENGNYFQVEDLTD